MALPTPNLDDLRFQQDLVDEARRRIIRYCPEWTEYNLSDPGITLIELFSWMTEMIVYRLNQVPEKNYVKFLELMGMQRQPASSARTELTFWLSVLLPIAANNDDPVIVPAGTQAVSRRVEDEQEIIFTTDSKLVIVPPRLTQLRRAAEFHKNFVPRMGIEPFFPFDRRAPQLGDTFYVGFDPDRDISGHVLRLTFDCESTQAVGVRREDPPWVWECSVGGGQWQEISPSKQPGEEDTTGGLNNPRGSLVLYLPLAAQADQIYGRNAFWVRCRLEQRRPEQGMYAESPRVTHVAAQTVGASVPATHAVIVANEVLGRSTGDPGQTFQLEHVPILALQDDEVLEIEERRLGETVFVPWQSVSDFSESERFDRHFAVDEATGMVYLGPSVRQPDGAVRQYGRVPEVGRSLRISRYRYGGGAAGNVPANALRTMTTSLAYISRVTNLRRASGGRDPENLDEVKARAQRELRAQLRAVTAEDYEQLTLKATRAVTRAKCNVPRGDHGAQSAGVIELLVVPSAADSLAVGDLSSLCVDEDLAREIESFLDQYRLLTAVVRCKEPKYLGVQVNAEIVPSEFSDPETIRSRVAERLRSFICPLALSSDSRDQDELVGEGLMDEGWEGWPFGRDLYVAEILSMIQRIPGVKHVLDVRLATRLVIPQEEAPSEDDLEETPEIPLDPVEDRVVRVASDTLLCSLEHEVVLASLDGEA